MPPNSPNETTVDIVKETGECYTIATTIELGPVIPYPSVQHPDGAINQGFVDLRERPELIESIAEAKGKPGLLALLHRINHPSSPLMSLGCENGVFQIKEPAPDGPLCYIGSYIDIAYRDVALATEDRILALAKLIIEQRKPKSGDWTIYELLAQPLRHFFGKPGFNLMLKILAHGRNETEAWEVFNTQCVKMEETFDHLFLVSDLKPTRSWAVDDES